MVFRVLARVLQVVFVPSYKHIPKKVLFIPSIQDGMKILKGQDIQPPG